MEAAEVRQGALRMNFSSAVGIVISSSLPEKKGIGFRQTESNRIIPHYTIAHLQVKKMQNRIRKLWKQEDGAEACNRKNASMHRATACFPRAHTFAAGGIP
jgi:hypothetical protein